MIALNVEQTLGRKAFWSFFSKKVTVAVISLIVTIIFSVASDALAHSSIARYLGPNLGVVISYISNGLALITIILCMASVLMSVLEYQNYTFTFEDFDLKIKRGVLNRRQESIPYHQIKNVTIEQSLGYRMMGLSKVMLSIMGGEMGGTPAKDLNDIVLEPIESAMAEDIRVMLQSRIGVQIIHNERNYVPPQPPAPTVPTPSL